MSLRLSCLLRSHALHSRGITFETRLGPKIVHRLALGSGASKQFSTTSTRSVFRSRRLLLVPLVGAGALLSLSPRNEPSVPTILANPTIIPCSARSNLFTHQLSSPLEERHSILRTIIFFLRDRIWEPILTARRFIYLAVLFGPVLLASPMLLVGSPKHGERWGAMWWYGFLVAQMQRAGPTFIKVIHNTLTC